MRTIKSSRPTHAISSLGKCIPSLGILISSLKILIPSLIILISSLRLQKEAVCDVVGVRPQYRLLCTLEN